MNGAAVGGWLAARWASARRTAGVTAARLGAEAGAARLLAGADAARRSVGGSAARRWSRVTAGRPGVAAAAARLATGASAVRRATGVAASRAVSVWRRSLQLRVVTTTLVSSTLVVAVLGLVVVDRVADGLVTIKRNQAVKEVESGQAYARQQLSTLGGVNDPETDATLRQVVANLSARGGRGGEFTVAIGTANRPLSPLYVAQYDYQSVVRKIPAQLKALLERRNTLAYQFTRTALDDSAAKPYLVVATPVETRAGRFSLYYFFPLDEEVSTVALVRNWLVVIGVLLLALLAGIAGIVTRQVVTPVRLAARTAERLSAGLLEERMAVHGEDDLARLAHSFNQMAANLQRQIVQLENLSRLQRRFTSDVSHELRTPLTTVRMAADLLYAAREDFPAEVARSAELLAAEVDRFESLLADLLEISRYDGGFAVLEPEATDVGVLVRDTVDGLAALAERAGVTCQVVLPRVPVVAEVDPRRVQRILRNLVGNAIEHAEGRPVRITLARDAEAVAVTVRDHGVGLSPAQTRVVFHRFWRADPSRTRQTGGTGLGLSISLEDARLHGGWLEAWGRPGEGAQLRLTLPLRAGARLTGSPLPLDPHQRPGTEETAGERPGGGGPAGEGPGGGGRVVGGRVVGGPDDRWPGGRTAGGEAPHDVAGAGRRE